MHLDLDDGGSLQQYQYRLPLCLLLQGNHVVWIINFCCPRELGGRAEVSHVVCQCYTYSFKAEEKNKNGKGCRISNRHYCEFELFLKEESELSQRDCKCDLPYFLTMSSPVLILYPVIELYIL